MATGPRQIYSKASEFQMRSGELVAGDFSTGVAANIRTGLTTVHSCFVTMNGDPAGTTNAAQITVDNNGDGTITVNQWTEAHAAAATSVSCSWFAVGAE